MQPVDADRVLSEAETGESFNDLEVAFWQTPDELRSQLESQFEKHLNISAFADIEGFNATLGLTPEGWVPFEKPSNGRSAEWWQVLSPVRMQPWGVHDVNRWVQGRFRASQLRSSREPWGLSLGDEEIVWGDKVILLRNGKRQGYDFGAKETVEEYLANGEIGIASSKPKRSPGRWMNVAFVNRDGKKFAFRPDQFGARGAPLELAYALTIHKAQGSEFGVVFVVLPERSRVMSRELLYTALTRAQDRLVLLVQGQDPGILYELSRPERSETARRNTNVFTAVVREQPEDPPYAEHLVHRTTRGEMVRSKSELVIANHLHSMGIAYYYERPLSGSNGRVWPDFSFIDDAGDVIVWEHLGMLDRDDYRRGWERKRAWYADNGYVEGENLFSTQEIDGLDSKDIEHVAGQVKAALA